MTEKYPPFSEFRFPGKIHNESSDLLKELAKIRKDIEQESMPLGHISDLDSMFIGNSEGLDLADIGSNSNPIDKSSYPEASRQFHRFDFGHVKHEDCDAISSGSKNMIFVEKPEMTKKTMIYGDIGCVEPFVSSQDKEFSRQPELAQADDYSKSIYFQTKPQETKTRKFRRGNDGTPVVIPIRQVEKRNTARHSKRSKGKPAKKDRCFPPEDHAKDHGQGPDIAISTLPWGLFSKYESETFVQLTSNASHLSLLIGWGAIASGVIIFVRSFFVSSMIWLNYGLPVLSLGATCLFLAIILSILSEKMQHINDLKQSMNAHLILNPAQNQPETHVKQANRELEDVYDRLLQLRSEINGLIDECESINMP